MATFENSKEIVGLGSAEAAIPVIAQCYTPQRALETTVQQANFAMLIMLFFYER